MLLCGYFCGGRSYSRSKHVPFESGIESTGNSKVRFSVKFYLIGMIFVIFDAEGIYLYVWSVSVREAGWMGFIEIFIFIIILLISLVYLIRTGAFNWVETSLKNENSNKTCLNVDNVLKLLKEYDR
ncbi:NADH-quinone oxidoreductase subunit A [Candidatus Blochmanniella vafra]|nr:NADH-quinone oxidoreductase subunit A [Candidatus Blochmannia vafer]